MREIYTYTLRNAKSCELWARNVAYFSALKWDIYYLQRKLESINKYNFFLVFF